MVKQIADVLVERDGYTPKEAKEAVKEARKHAFEMLENGEMPWDICEDEFGLEPDYLEDLV